MKASTIHRLLLPLAVMFVFSLAGCSRDNETGFLEDRPNLLSTAEREHLVKYNRALLKDLDIHFKLIILDERAEDINRTAAEIFGSLGKETHGAKGLLFLVDPVGQQVRIEVGYDLEEVFPDVFVGYLEQAQMVPFFDAGKTGPGIEATTELFVARVQEAIEGHAFDPAQELPDLASYSGGGGARIETGTASRTMDKRPAENGDSFHPQQTPELTLKEYARVLRLHVKDPHLSIYTPATREFFANWVVTDAQQDNSLRTLEKAPEAEVKISVDLAVLRYPIASRLNAPYFFTEGEDGWMLDFATMSRVLQMNHKNMWMMRKTDHPYMFAFSDWKFDKNGFPVSEKQ